MKRFVVLSAMLVCALSVNAAQAVFDGRLVDEETGMPRANDKFEVVPKFFSAETGGVQLGCLDKVTVETDENGNFSFYSGEWDNPDGIENIWLGVTDRDGKEIVPRKRISSAPYAIHANKVKSVYGNGYANVEKLDLADTSFGTVENLVVSNEVIWGTNNLVSANVIEGFDTVSLPDIRLDSSRYFSGMSRYLWGANYPESNVDLFEEKKNGSMFRLDRTESRNVEVIRENVRYSQYSWPISIPTDGLLTLHFNYKILNVDITKVKEMAILSSKFEATVSIEMYPKGDSSNRSVFNLWKSKKYQKDYFLDYYAGWTGKMTWNVSSELPNMFLTLPVPGDYVVRVIIEPNSEWKNAMGPNANRSLSVAQSFYPFCANEK